MKDKTIKCKLCGRLIADCNLSRHIRVNHGLLLYLEKYGLFRVTQTVTCLLCGKFISKSHLNSHIRKYHDIDEYLQNNGLFRQRKLMLCKLCHKKIFINDFMCHIEKLHNLNLYIKFYGKINISTCKLCGKTMLNRNLIKHIESQHNINLYITKHGLFRDDLILCKLCGKYVNLTNLSKHIKANHNVLLYINKHGLFQTKIKTINKHKIHQLINALCKICNLKFKLWKQLFYHTKKQHKLLKWDYIKKYIFKNLVPLCQCGCGELTKIKLNFPFRSYYISGHNPTVPYLFTNLQRAKISLSAKLRFSKNSNISGWHNPLSKIKAIKKYQKTVMKKKLKKYNVKFMLKKITSGVLTYSFKCNVCGGIMTYLHNKLVVSCPTCNKLLIKQYGSLLQKELYDFLKTITNELIIISNRTILNGLLLDLYLPNSGLAIEYNGLKFHNDKYIENNYHINKTKLCLNLGIRLIHVFSDLWNNKNLIVKHRISNVINKNIGTRVYARKCLVKLISPKQKNEFLNSYHLLGKDSSSIRLGLFHNDTLISVMTFGKLRPALGSKSPNLKTFLLIRFATNYSYIAIGGASKLLSHFIKNYSPLKIISYADRRWSSPIVKTLYDNLGFVYIGNTKPNYYYTKDFRKRIHRFNFTKKQLVKMGNDPNKTLKLIMILLGYLRIWDCGHLKYLMII